MDEHRVNGYSDTDNSAYSFHLVLLTDADEMLEMWLPKIPEGFFSFADKPEYSFLNIVAKDGKWIAVCQKPAFIKDVPAIDCNQMAIYDGALLKIKMEEHSYTLFVEKVTRKRMIFHNYNVRTDTEITVGSAPDNDIYYKGPYVSRQHAVLRCSGGRWIFTCNDNVYGAYVNGKKTAYQRLKLGDAIYIMGLKIMVGINSLSINNGIGEVTVNGRIIEENSLGSIGYSHYYTQQKKSDDGFFNRLPRKRREVEGKTISIEGPPMSMSKNQMPLMLRLGSSMVMGGAAALAGNFLTLITSVLFPFLSSKYTDAQRADYEKLRNTKYTEYLNEKKREIEEAIEVERIALNKKYPLMESLTSQNNISKHLWERRPCDSDFLQLRLGKGNQRLRTKIDYPQKRFGLEKDNLEERMFELAEKPYYVNNVPITLSLIDEYVSGITGDHNQVMEFIRQLSLQLSVLHSYDEVKMIFLISKDDMMNIDGIQYLPHSWDDNRTIRFIANSESEAYVIGEYLQDITEGEKEEKEINKILKNRPYFVIFALDKKLFDSHEVFKEFLQADTNRGVSVVVTHDALPKESQKIITLNLTQNNVCTTMGVDGGEDEIFETEWIDSNRVREITHKLANTSLKKINQAQVMPKMITFLEMFNKGRIEQLNPLKRWSDNNPVKSLATPVGVGADGELFMLDLHEKHQGPHGLVAGMTGSGKSEFIITYILSMAVNYHPDEVAFVLIDYKGGGLAGAFENPQTGTRLPHLVGTITNLDGASIQRSLMSIESELLRRQRLFNETKSIVNEGTMDIYSYQKLYRAGKVSEPVPHLFIVSDEFAELKQQQPEFMDKLISAARIGRSLGVHLILATQKPSGVVNDQIRSNTKFRVCLRVQERADSMDMLKRPEAAELTDTGRFYLQVGYNEYFAVGQSAWCGAPYEPQDRPVVRRDEAIEFLDTTGKVIATAKPKMKKSDSGMKQIVATVKYLSELAKAHNIEAKQLWKPELPKKVDVDELVGEVPVKEPMEVALGILDDPKNQNQFTMSIDFKTCQNILITGCASSGKTSMVQSIIYTLAKQLTPQQFNFYALDYSSRMLKLFKPLAHCGTILQEEDSASLDSFFSLINSIIAERKKLFSQLEVDNFEAASKLVELPLVLVVIDNISGLSASKVGEAHNYRLQSYLKNSAVYGVKYIVTCNQPSDVPSRIRAEFGERISFHLIDKYSYNDFLGCKVSYIPPEISGRGLYKVDDCPLEFQGAIVGADLDEKERVRKIKEMVDNSSQLYPKKDKARYISEIKEDAEYEEFAGQFELGRIPLGFSKADGKPVALPLKQMSLLSLYFGNPDATKVITGNFMYALQRNNAEIWVVKRLRDSWFDGKENTIENADFISSTKDDLLLLQKALIGEKKRRKNILESVLPDGNSVVDVFQHPLVIYIESFADFHSAMSPLGVMSYVELFKNISKFGICVIACFEPDIAQKASENILFSKFEDNDVLFFGGNYAKQKLFAFSSNLQGSTVVPYNQVVMKYRGELHQFLMPCGKVEVEEIDEDLESIF